MASLATIFRDAGLPMLEARILAAHALGVDRVWVSAHDRDELGDPTTREIESLCRRRRDGEPVAYLTGEREFYGLSFAVSPAVLIPRPETELLVDCAIPFLAKGGRVLDLGTGSGAIAIAIAKFCPKAEVIACDTSHAALRIAKANAERHGAKVSLAESDWFAAFKGERFDWVVSNPPYIPVDDPHLAVGDLRYEPRDALVAGKSGMECIAAIASAAREHLIPGGHLLLEHGYDQGAACVSLAAELGYVEISDHGDLAGMGRTLQARFDPSVHRR